MLDVLPRARRGASPSSVATGLPLVGAVPRGSRLGLLHRGSQLQVVAGYILTGLQAGERCVWYTADPVSARAALAPRLRTLPEAVRRGHLDIVRVEALDPADLEERARATRRLGAAGMRVAVEFLAEADCATTLTLGGEAGRELTSMLCVVRVGEDPVLPPHAGSWFAGIACVGGGWTLLPGPPEEPSPDEDLVARVQQVTAALAEATTPEAVARVVVREMAGATGAEIAMLAVPSEDGRELRVLDAMGVDAVAARRWRRIDVDAALPGAEAYRTGRSIWLSSAEEIVGRYGSNLGPPHLGPSAAFAAVPLCAGGRHVGVVALGFTQARPFEARYRRLLEDLGRQIVIALDRARLLQESARQRDRLQLLADATARLSRAGFEVDAVLDTLTSEVASGTFAERCVVYAVEGGRSRRVSSAGADLASADDARDAFVLEVADTAAALRVSPVDHEAVTQRPTRGSNGPLLLVPLRRGDRVAGVVVAERDAGREPFCRDDADLLQELTDRAALLVDYARLYAEAQADRLRAEQANRAKDQFLAMLGHELRNPLSPIVTVLQLMERRGDAPFARERAVMDRQVRHMVRLVDDLLDVSRIARGTLEIRRSLVHLDAVVDHAIESTAPLLRARGHTLELQVPRGFVLVGDADRLTQVVANLLSNAAKYTPAGGRVSLRAEGDAEVVRLVVADDGQGIAPELLPAIFDAFTQGHQGIDRTQGGLGLGLSIARAMAEQHGGRLWAESPGLGRGSVFTLELPLGLERLPVAVEDPATGGLTVLVVDENPGAAELVSRSLAAAGHTPHPGDDLDEALVLAERAHPEVALVDLRQVGAASLVQHLRRVEPCMTVIGVSPAGCASDARLVEALGLDAHLTKPLDLAALPGLLRALHRG